MLAIGLIPYFSGCKDFAENSFYRTVAARDRWGGESVIVSVQGTAELGSLSHMSIVEQLQARADHFSYGIHGEGKNLVGHNLIRLLG
jgi:hypothetical protein